MKVAGHLQGKVQHYMFVSSAGAYEANSVEPMHVEGDSRKKSAGKFATLQQVAMMSDGKIFGQML